MAQINQYGYQKIREYILSSWKYIEVQDESVVPPFNLYSLIAG